MFPLSFKQALLAGAASSCLLAAPLAHAQQAPEPKLNEPQTPISAPDAPVLESAYRCPSICSRKDR